MNAEALYDLTVAFSLVSGTAAGMLAALTWEILRESPLGRASVVLSAALVAFIVYHVVVLVWPDLSTVLSVVRSAMYTGIAAFVWAMVWFQRNMRQRTDDRHNPT